MQVEAFRARVGVKIAVTDEEAQRQGETDDGDVVLEQIKLALARVNAQDTPRLNAIDFEKVYCVELFLIPTIIG